MYLLDRAGLALSPTGAGRDNQGLTERMGVPRDSSDGIEQEQKEKTGQAQEMAPLEALK